jgi:hypothetical protein
MLHLDILTATCAAVTSTVLAWICQITYWNAIAAACMRPFKGGMINMYDAAV